MIAIGVLAIGGVALGAQDNQIVLTLAMSEWMVNSFDDAVFADFEAAHPGVDVVLVSPGDSMYPTPVELDMEQYLDDMATFAASADVLIANRWNLKPAATQTGYFLDLTPLTSTDTALDPADFYPTAWESYQWDGGFWAFPASIQIMILTYDPAAFDAAGLAYPDADWTLNDFITAAQALTQRGDGGEVTVPGFSTFFPQMVLRALLGENLYDDSVVPAQPRLDTPEMTALLETWFQMIDEGTVGLMGPDAAFDPNTTRLPMRVDATHLLRQVTPGDEPSFAGALLPGGTALLEVDGFAVSAGTQHPELAYELAKYLTATPEIVLSMYGDTPARRSLGEATAENVFRPPMPPNVQPVIDAAIAQGIPVSGLRYTSYLNTALRTMGDERPDAATALQEAQEQAMLGLQTVEARRGTASVTVATPVPTPVLAPGEVSLSFGMFTYMSSLPNPDRWDQVSAEFVAADPQVGQIELDTWPGQTSLLAEQYDCYYMPYNDVPTVSLDTILALDPFLDADPAFDADDYVAGTLAQAQRNGQTWMLPLALEPLVMWYNSRTWSEAGLAPPEDGWTADAFADAMQRLKPLTGDDAVVIPYGTIGNTYLLMLIAAYGGLPMDYRSGSLVPLTCPQLLYQSQC